METRNEKDRYDAMIPQVTGEYCTNCHQPLKDRAHFNEHRESDGIGYVIMNAVCCDCIEEIIQYKHKIRTVSEITKDLPGFIPAEERFNKALYFKAYDWINFGQTYK